MRNLASFRIALALFLAVSVSSGLLAQAPTTAVLQGVVRDADSGEVLAGALLTLSGPWGAEVQTANEKGEYRFPAVRVGTYDLTATLEGYQPLSYAAIQLNPGERRLFSFDLTRSKLEETIVVQAKPTMVDTRETAVKETVDAEYVNRIPLTSRRFQEVLSLFPGVARATGTTSAQFTVQGGRTRENGYRLDGATINDVVTGTFGANVPQNAIERFELLLNGFQAEYGENNAGIANIITKSGTNEFELFYSDYYRSDGMFSSEQDELDELGAEHNPRPETQRWIELNVGGPLVEDKAFYFAAFQYWREDVGNVFQSNIRDGDRYNFFTRFDFNLNPKNRLSVSLNTDPASFDRNILSRSYSPESNRDQTQGGYIINVRDDHSFNERTHLESQFVLQHQYLTSRPSSPDAGPYTRTYSTTAPSYVTGAYYNNQDRSTDRFRIRQKLTKVLGAQGKHLMKVGYDFDYINWDGMSRSSPVYLDFRDYGPLGDIDGDTVDDYIAYRYEFTPQENHLDETKFAAFIQDTWQPDNHWTLDFGARVDHQSIVKDLEFSPRLGLSWDPLGDGTQKAYLNLGRFYGDLFLNVATFGGGDLYEYLTLFSGDSGGRVPDANDPLFSNDLLMMVQTYFIDGDLDTPYKDQWTVGYQRALPWDMRGEVFYTQWDSKNDPITWYDDTTGENWLTTSGRSEYRGWVFSLRKQFSHRTEFMVSYTNSVARGDDYRTFGFLDPNDPAVREGGFARLRSDRTDIINASALFTLPDDWDLTVIYHYATGRAYSVTERTTEGSKIKGVRNDYRLPSQRQWDLAVSKKLHWGKRNDLKLVGQVLNVFNSFNAVELDGYWGDARWDPPRLNPGFQQPTSVDLGRLVQIGIEYRF
jgi:hypothetical protein